MSDMVIEVKNLCCRSGNRYLLNHINWKVKQGEHWLIFGLNGSGKTTLLSTIAGFNPITSGELMIFDEHYNKNNIFELRKKVGLVSNSLFDRVYHNESALQIVLSGLFGTFNVEFGVSDKDVRFAKALLRELRMGDKIHQSFGTMSKGERQNVLIARALITKPKVLLLDEPTSGLDIYARDHLYETVSDLAESGQVTILYVTHYAEEIPAFLKKALFLRNGHLFAQGEIERLMRSECVSALLNENVQVSRDSQGLLHMATKAPSNIYKICYSD
jgi:iron complex transport system ATP-binding protein